MNKKWTWIVVLVMILAAAGLSLFAFPRLPDQIVSHWNAQGQPDDTMGKFWGLALFPLVMLGITLLLFAMPLIDPLRENIEAFRPTYHLFIVFFNTYLLYIHFLSVLWNLGVQYDLNLAIIPAMAVLFFIIGMLLKRSRRNWFIGIRTPWTLSSDRVWEQTHRRGALLFKLSAAVILLGVVFPDMLFFFILVPTLLLVVYLVVYSYVLFRRNAD